METKPDSGRKAQADAQAAGIATGHIILGLVLSLLSVGVFALVWEQVEDKSHLATGFDRAVLFWLWHHQVPWITTVAKGLAWMGSPPVIVSMAAIGAVLGLFWRRVRGAAWTLPLAVLGAGVIIQGIKMEFRRPRPDFFTPLLHETGYSFPSGHSLIAIVVYGLLGYFAMHLFRNHAARVAVGAITVLLVIAIGVSRVYVAVHYPTDVLAGWTAGLPWLLTCLWLHERLTRRYANAGEPVLHLPPEAAKKAAGAGN